MKTQESLHQPRSFPTLPFAILGALAMVSSAVATDSFHNPNSPNLPARRLDEAGPLPPKPPAGTVNAPARYPAEFRPITGAGTNPAHPEWGSANTAFIRLTPPAYADGKDAPSGPTRPSARAISNAVVAQTGLIPNAAGASAMLWQWGQFIDHDLDLSPTASPAEEFDVPVPTGDPSFDPSGGGNAVIALDRTLYLHDAAGVRQQINDLNSFIDGSQVYGVDEARATALRTLDGTGRLKTSAGNLLPFNTAGLPNAPADTADFFVAGDFRVDEQVALMAIQTLFLREHNHWADYFHAQDSTLTDEQVYRQARAIVGAEIQAITYREFLPILLGPEALSSYQGYRPEVNPSVSTEFATAAYRVGHTMLSPTLLRLKADGTPHADGELSLAAAFFNVAEITKNGIEPILSGLTVQVGQEVDNHLVDEVRNFLFGAPGSPGFDLASLNIQRGRDHGIGSYNQVRTSLGLKAAGTFADVSADATTQANLTTAYGTSDKLDLWVGGLAEKHRPGAMVGETFLTILRDQFTRARDGDRFWYQGYLPPEWVKCVEQQTLSTIIRRNTVTPGWKIAPNAFLAATPTAVEQPSAGSSNPQPKPTVPPKKKAPKKPKKARQH